MNFGYNTAGERPKRPEAKLKKPPLGLKPKWLVDEKRMTEISVAITLRLGECLPIPREWIAEYNKLSVTYQKREAKKEEALAKARAASGDYR